MPSSIVVHIHNGWIESSLVNLHPSPFTMLHFEACFTCPRHWNLTLATIALKLIDRSWFWGWWTLFCNSYQLIPLVLCFGISVTNNLLIIPPLHDHGISQDASIHFSMVLMSWTPLEVESLPGLAFFATMPCTSFKCLVNNHLAQYANANFTLPFRPNFCPFFVLPSQIKWTRGCRWLKSLVSFKL